METAKPAAAATQRGRCPILTQVPVGLIAAITVLFVIAVIGLALAMAVHGSHQMNLASSGIAWANT
jgi:hypothetical protein